MMPIMSFDLQDGKPPVSFSINIDGAQRFMDFMAECSAAQNAARADLPAPATEIQRKTPDATDAEVDKHLDAVLRASGSALRHYSLQMTLDQMRAAMRAAMGLPCTTPR